MDAKWTEAATALVAIAALLLSIYNTFEGYKLRRASHYDRRHNFYQRFLSRWLATSDGQTLDPDDAIPYAEEAGFLFGKDVAAFVMSRVGKKHTGSPFFADDEFVAPFEKYLTL